MIPRTMLPRLVEAAEKYPVATLFGPRQSGKTTLVKAAFPQWRYVNLEQSRARQLAQTDPTLFFEEFPRPLVIDEVQRVPELLSEIQVLADETNAPGQFVLTGSHQPLLQDKVAQSLAGRTALLDLYPLSLAELSALPDAAARGRDQTVWTGGLPRIFDQALDPPEVCEGWFRTYVERDVRQLANLRHLSRFETFVRLLAGRVGQLLNVHALAGDAGVSVPTAKEWLSVMEASYVIRILRPFHRNWGKRFVKSPKVYFTEPGLAAWLLGIRSADQIATHPLMGNLFENMVVMELVKDRLNRGEEPDLYFLRTASGLEADVVAEHAGRLDFFEIKACSTYHADMAAGLEKLASFIPEAGTRTVVYCGRTLGPVRGTDFRNFAELFPSPEDTPRQRRKPGN